MKKVSNNTAPHIHGGGGNLVDSSPAILESTQSTTTPTLSLRALAQDKARQSTNTTHTDSLPCHTDLEQSEREVSTLHINKNIRDTSPTAQYDNIKKADSSMDCRATATAVSRNDSKSTATKLALSISLIAAAALELAANCDTNHNVSHTFNGKLRCMSYTDENVKYGAHIALDNSLKMSYTKFDASKYSQAVNFRAQNNHTVEGDVTLEILNNKGTYWNFFVSTGGIYEGTNSTIRSLTIKGSTKLEINLSGDATITTLNHNADSLNLEANKLTVTTLNQTSGTTNHNKGTITTLNLKGGVFNHNGGTLSNVVLQEGDGVFNNNANSAFASITQEGGNHTIGKGKSAITSFTLKSGSLTNNGTITTLTTNTTTRETRAADTNNGTFRAAQTRATTNHITNNGTIDKLELKQEGDSVTNNAVYNTGGGLASGIIKELDVKSGNATINTLNGVGQGTAANVEPHTLSNINIKANDAKLTVDTLSVGLKGNTAIERVTINNNTGNSGGNKEFAVNKIQVTYLDGDFDPAKSISKNLTDYVSSGTSQSYVDGASKPTFESSPELQGIGVKFNPDGTPIFEVEASLAASMTSMVVRQSMRRKMLLDTYLAEQSRRSLKNKERRTKQRLEAATLGEARAKYQKDLEKYKLDLAKWDKLASTKENKALIAKYEQEDKAYQKALEQYQKDKAKWDKLSEKDKAKLSGSPTPAPIAPIEPKAPIKPNLKPNHKDYKKAMADFTKAQQAHKAALAKYEKDLEKYKLDKAKWDKDNQKLAANTKPAPIAPIEPKAPTKPKIIASKPIMPQEPQLGEVSQELLAKHQVQGDFFIRPYGGVGDHKAAGGAQTSSWSAGTLIGANWDLALGNSQGNIGFYGGYEYLYNGYKQAHIDAQGHTGFVGLRFSHLFARTKLAGFYYLADINGGYSDISVGQDMNGMRFAANVGNINFGSSIRLGSSIYMAGAKSMLFPSIGVGVEGGYLGDFEMRTNRSGELRYGGLSQGYAVTYAQANLNYYQEYGKRISTTLGGGFRYLMNADIGITPTLNGKAYTIEETTGRAAAVHLAPFFYQGTFMVNYHTDKAGNFSAGYVAVGGLLGITHNASMRWHYFF